LTRPATLLGAAGPRAPRASSTIRSPEGAGRGEGLAGFIIVCARDRSAAPFTAADLRRCALALGPDTIKPNAPDVHEEEGLVRAVVNPVDGVRIEPRGVCLGALFEEADWATVGAARPDGTYAIARHDSRALELVSDVFASRTVWYVHDDRLFLASTSQRALVMLLGSFAPRAETVTWMMAAGNLGPECGWDERLRRLPLRTRLHLDRETWTMTEERDELVYEARDLTRTEHLAALREAIFGACARLDTEGVRSALTLSGGCDSRSLLVGLANAGKKVTCVTWGLAASIDDPKNDAAIARDLARRFGMEHEYLHLDPGDTPAREVLTRFLAAGEGRIEDFSGYTDAFAAWRRLFVGGVATIIRGDCPGWGSPYPPLTDDVARAINMHITLEADYPEGHVIHRLGLAPQTEPREFYRRDGETLDQYRDRIYNDGELPTNMAAFSDVKCRYAEVVNPLYARAVVDVTRQMPDDVRHVRNGFEELASTLVPGVPFADNPADEQPEHYLARRDMVDELTRELTTAGRDVFAAAAVEQIVAGLGDPMRQTRSRLRQTVKAVVPRRLVRAVRPAPRPSVDSGRLAFRAYIASRMTALLREDAELLRDREPRPPTSDEGPRS
jgi:hypothetical protein